MSSTHKDRFKTSEEAALWLIRLQEDDSPGTRAQFTAWARQSPVHVEELLFAQATSRHLEGVDAARRIDLATLDAPDGMESVVSLISEAIPQKPARKTKPGLRIAVALAASILILVVAGQAWLATRHAETVYATAAGDQQAIKLPDGSVMHLNTASRARIEFDAGERAIHLLSGEALFVVESDPARPFRVVAGDSTIQALGTQFNVYRRDTGTQVSVIEGAVRVASKDVPDAASMELLAGDEARVTAGRPVKIAAPDVQRAVSWRARKLMFQSDPLEAVVREFNRYDSRRPIRVEGEELRRRVISGVFDADDPQPLIAFLEEDPALRVVRTDTEIVVQTR